MNFCTVSMYMVYIGLLVIFKCADIASSWLPRHNCSAMMDDDSCVMKYIEILPVSDVRDCSEFTDVKQEPVHVKVCVC